MVLTFLLGMLAGIVVMMAGSVAIDWIDGLFN